MVNTILLTDDAELHGSQWLADIPLRAGSPTTEQLRSVQGVRAPITFGSFHADDAIVVLANVADGVETWRVYKAASSSWSAPTIAPDGTKTFTAPGVTMVEHPPGPGESFPSWTTTTDASSTDCRISDASIKPEQVRCTITSVDGHAHEVKPVLGTIAAIAADSAEYEVSYQRLDGSIGRGRCSADSIGETRKVAQSRNADWAILSIKKV